MREQILDQRRLGLSEREEKQLKALQRRKKRQREGHFLAEGVRVVEDLLDSGVVVEWVLAASSLADSERGGRLLAEVERQRLPLRIVPEETLRQLAPTEHSQGIVAVARAPTAEWSVVEREEAGAVVLLLDAVQDPGNLGTLARTAEALGALAVVVLPGTVDPWNPKSVRASAGSLFRVPILLSSWSFAEETLHAADYRLVAAEAGGDAPEVWRGRVGLVMGNEGAGISPEVRERVDGIVGVPLRGRAESLNVAAAAAILLYELTR